MQFTGFLLWLAASVLITAVANSIFRFSLFSKDTKAIGDLKVAIVMVLSLVFAITYVLLNNTVAIFGYFGLNIYPIEDAIFSGIIISFGADFVYQIYQTILNYRDKVKAQGDVAKATAASLKKM